MTENENFFSHLNMEHITGADYKHAKRVCKNLKIKNWGEDHDLYVQSDTLLLPDVLDNFWKMCLKKYELDPARFFSVSGLAWQRILKLANVKLDHGDIELEVRSKKELFSFTTKLFYNKIFFWKNISYGNEKIQILMKKPD